MEEGRPSEARLVSLEIEDGVAQVKQAGNDKVYHPSLLLPPKKMALRRMFLACMVSGGIQYGWALQLSLLSPQAQVWDKIAPTMASLFDALYSVPLIAPRPLLLLNDPNVTCFLPVCWSA